MNPRDDLTYIFERDDVRDAISEHCDQHPHRYETCERCRALRLVLATAILEWRDGCELHGSVVS